MTYLECQNDFLEFLIILSFHTYFIYNFWTSTSFSMNFTNKYSYKFSRHATSCLPLI